MKETVNNHRGLAKAIKFSVPSWLFRFLRPALNSLASVFPYSVKYGLANRLKRNKYPYCLLRESDIVVQVGAPRDLLIAGRSRAVHFAQIVKSGRVIVVEPDPGNCAALKKLIQKRKLGNRVTLVEMGAWSESGELEFLTSPDHPAANVLRSAKEIDPEVMRERNYSVIRVPVSRLDDIVADLGIQPEEIGLVSITVNGAEPQIIEGMDKLISGGLGNIALAETAEGYPEMMESLGYRRVAIDDRGFTFKRKPA